MSRFWAAASSSEGEQGSDSDSYDEAQPTQKLAEKKFGATFEESDSGESIVQSQRLCIALAYVYDRSQIPRMK